MENLTPEMVENVLMIGGLLLVVASVVTIHTARRRTEIQKEQAILTKANRDQELGLRGIGLDDDGFIYSKNDEYLVDF